MERKFVLRMGIYICKLFSLNSKSKSGLEKMKTIQISPVITLRVIVQLTGEQRVFIVLSYTRTLIKALSHGAIFLATCNAILFLVDTEIGKYTFPSQFANIFLTYQTFVTNLHLLRVELRC